MCLDRLAATGQPHDQSESRFLELPCDKHTDASAKLDRYPASAGPTVYPSVVRADRGGEDWRALAMWLPWIRIQGAYRVTIPPLQDRTGLFYELAFTSNFPEEIDMLLFTDERGCLSRVDVTYGADNIGPVPEGLIPGAKIGAWPAAHG